MLQLVGCFAIWSAVVELCANNLLFVWPSRTREISNQVDPDNANQTDLEAGGQAVSRCEVGSRPRRQCRDFCLARQGTKRRSPAFPRQTLSLAPP